MNFDLSFKNRFGGKARSVVLNCGESIELPDGRVLGNFESGVFQDVSFEGEKLIIIEIGENNEVTPEIAEQIRKVWKTISEVFGAEEFKGLDVYMSERIEQGGLAFKLFYFGAGIPGRTHNEHDFFELHTVILGKGEMQKIREDKETIYERVEMAPGITHKPFFDDNMNYPWHRYESITASILLAMESPERIPQEK